MEDVMVGIKQATVIAHKYLKSLYKGKIYELQLEEVEYSEDRNYLLITFSYSETPFYGLAQKRKYKILKIDALSGEVESMKIREFE